MSSSTETRPLIYRQLALPSTPESIHQVENVVEEIRAELEFKEDVYANVMVAVTEAVNNSIIHGNDSDSSKKVYLEFEIPNSYRLLIRVHDEGPGFDPADLPDPTAPHNIDKIGGRGVFLMSQLADKLLFSQDGKQVEMIFDI
jgi:serine/threonine-protein kinase RsbW